MAERLIDANNTDFMQDISTSADVFTCMRRFLEQAPTIDAEPVVRCKDCRYCDPENKHCDHPMGTLAPFPRKDDDFCSYGVAKMDEVSE